MCIGNFYNRHIEDYYTRSIENSTLWFSISQTSQTSLVPLSLLQNHGSWNTAVSWNTFWIIKKQKTKKRKNKKNRGNSVLNGTFLNVFYCITFFRHIFAKEELLSTLIQRSQWNISPPLPISCEFLISQGRISQRVNELLYSFTYRRLENTQTFTENRTIRITAGTRWHP